MFTGTYLFFVYGCLTTSSHIGWHGSNEISTTCRKVSCSSCRECCVYTGCGDTNLSAVITGIGWFSPENANSICWSHLAELTVSWWLQGHTKPIHSVCWDPSGEYLASVSEDSVRVWTVGSGSEGDCVHELSCNGNKFHSCVFHPNYPSLLVIGCYQASYFICMHDYISINWSQPHCPTCAWAHNCSALLLASDNCVNLKYTSNLRNLWYNNQIIICKIKLDS